ncbi:hypothetical protein [Actinokineospora iranica]|uniref:DUF3040 domain-containing protein n=1 Tax=Actinokineospora iranica TaxID=1271860 RepID=A0A1G6UC63_9PSEU|nr:hypothetical protein [Actinokineospora iranica]SDD38980.1 hypothetical protein SAMN05216174_110207 [Actinokineospora iranica]
MRRQDPDDDHARLSEDERHAFDDIARRLAHQSRQDLSGCDDCCFIDDEPFGDGHSDGHSDDRPRAAPLVLMSCAACCVVLGVATGSFAVVATGVAVIMLVGLLLPYPSTGTGRR